MTLVHAHGDAVKPHRVVVLGASGFIGRQLLARLTSAGVSAVGLSSRDIDLAQSDAATRLVEHLRPKVVLVFLAALTPDKGRDSGTLVRNLAMGRAVCEAANRVELAQLVYGSS